MIEEGFGGFPKDEKLCEAIHMTETLQHCVFVMARMETRYVQMVVDRIQMSGIAAKEQAHQQGCFALAEALTALLDDRDA